nr:cobalt-precorrin-6A reductase [Methylobacterium gnaphalii]
MPVLILGGTSEASALLRMLTGNMMFALTLSLAGRTSKPAVSSVPTRIGGFGGAEGLTAWLIEHRIARVIDATHPFAARISRNAATACAQSGVPLLAIRRPAWQPIGGDDWTEVADMEEAAAALGPVPRRVVLTIGRQELAAFARAPQHDYLARTIEPVGDIVSLPRWTEVSARGPFTLDDEIAFLRDAKADVLVTKNSGGAATSAKISAARALGIPVVIVKRPEMPNVPSVADVKEALRWLAEPLPSSHAQQTNPGPNL